jgi:hypothetical protein
MRGGADERRIARQPLAINIGPGHGFRGSIDCHFLDSKPFSLALKASGPGKVKNKFVQQDKICRWPRRQTTIQEKFPPNQNVGVTNASQKLMHTRHSLTGLVGWSGLTRQRIRHRYGGLKIKDQTGGRDGVVSRAVSEIRG